MLIPENPCPCWHNLFSKTLCKMCLKALKNSLNTRNIPTERIENLKIISLSQYDEAMKNFILSCKSASFNGLMPAQKNFLRILCAHWGEELKEEKVDAIVPIPAHPIRSILQTDLAWLFARYLSQGLELDEPLSPLKRKTFVNGNFYSAQKNLSAKQRSEKIKKQYYVNKAPKIEKKIYLVDDVCTTGSTLRYCKEILEAANYKVVAAVVLSKVKSRSPQTGASA